jgi:hypothetical protein
MRTALTDLKLTEMHVIHAGRETFRLSKDIQAVALEDLHGAIKPFR